MHGWVDPAYGVQVFREYIFGRRQKVNIGTCTNWGQIIPLASVYKTYNYGCRCEKTHGLWFRTYTKSRHQNFFNIFTFSWFTHRLFIFFGSYLIFFFCFVCSRLCHGFLLMCKILLFLILFFLCSTYQCPNPDSLVSVVKTLPYLEGPVLSRTGPLTGPWPTRWSRSLSRS